MSTQPVIQPATELQMEMSQALDYSNKEDQKYVINHLIRGYLRAGGAKMSETDYQKYKLAILLDWLKRRRLYEEKKIPIPGAANLYHLDIKELESDLVCTGPDCTFTTKDVCEAVNHLVTHYPDWFYTKNIGALDE